MFLHYCVLRSVVNTVSPQYHKLRPAATNTRLSTKYGLIHCWSPQQMYNIFLFDQVQQPAVIGNYLDF